MGQRRLSLSQSLKMQKNGAHVDAKLCLFPVFGKDHPFALKIKSAIVPLFSCFSHPTELKAFVSPQYSLWRGMN